MIIKILIIIIKTSFFSPIYPLDHTTFGKKYNIKSGMPKYVLGSPDVPPLYSLWL